LSRSLDSTWTTLAAALSIPSITVCVSFNTLGVHICNNGRDITLGTTTYTGLGRKAISAVGFGESLGVEVPAPSVSIVSNDQTYQAHVISDSLRDDTATITIAYYDSGAWTSTGWATTFRVDTDGGGANGVTVNLRSSDAVKGLSVPRRTTQEDGCQHDFKRGLCGYRGALKSCDKTLNGVNGCKAHFPDLTWTENLQPTKIVQPKPFGGFPGGLPHSLVRRG
jgi:hypothetical protein